MSAFSVRFENTLKQALGNLQIIVGDRAIPLAITLGPEEYIKSHLFNTWFMAIKYDVVY